MIRAIKRSKHILMLAGLALGLFTLLACGTEAATPTATTQPTSAQSQAELAPDLASLPSTLLTQPVERSGGESPQPSANRELVVPGGLVALNSNTGIWVTGRGEATSTPDLAILNLSIEALGDTVTDARGQAATAMEGTIAALSANGIADRDIQTRFFNISPKYTSREVTRCPAAKELSAGQNRFQPDHGCFTEHERVIVGYQVSNQVTVKVRDLNTVGDVIDQVTEAGGDLTRFQGITFSIEDTEALQDEARAAAIDDLLAKSSQVADLSGVELGQLVYIIESGGPAQVQFASERAFAASAMANPTPILAGELNVVVTMQAIFEIQRSGS